MQKNPQQPGNNFVPDKQNGQNSWESTQVRGGLQEKRQGGKPVLLPSNRPRTPGPFSVS